MKIKVNVIDKKSGKKTTGEAVIRNREHFEIQKNNKAHVFINRKKRAKQGYRKHKGEQE